MFRSIDVPELAIVRALSAGGPYIEDDAISVAFNDPTVGRLVSHGPRERVACARAAEVPILPETISVVVTSPAAPYRRGDVLTLSFVDPAIARIHATAKAGTSEDAPAARPEPEQRENYPDPTHAVAAQTSPDVTTIRPEAAAQLHPQAAGVREAIEPQTTVDHSVAPSPAAAPAPTGGDGAPSSARISFDVGVPFLDVFAIKAPDTIVPLGVPARGVRLSLAWSEDRVRRFVQMTDKLFTVDRLGWYRHAFAMRLLVPDDISCGTAGADLEAARHLRTLRAAALETLGRPLIASFMPSFEVTPAWLDTIDSPDAAKAVFGLRETIAACSDAEPDAVSGDAYTTRGTITANDLAATPAGSIEAFLPLLIADVSAFDDVTDRLGTYRRALIDLFGGTARSSETVRLGQMTQPNHTLDDRLWQLVGTIGERFGGLAVA